MAKFEVSRYLVVTTEVEADTAEQALEIEQNLKTEVHIENLQSAIQPTYWWSENSAWVDDENGDTVLEG